MAGKYLYETTCSQCCAKAPTRCRCLQPPRRVRPCCSAVLTRSNTHLRCPATRGNWTENWLNETGKSHQVTSTGTGKRNGISFYSKSQHASTKVGENKMCLRPVGFNTSQLPPVIPHSSWIFPCSVIYAMATVPQRADGPKLMAFPGEIYIYMEISMEFSDVCIDTLSSPEKN